jgi:hypothetical protein
MPFKTPDDFPGPRFEDEIQFFDQYGVMPPIGGMAYSDGYFYVYDSYGIFNLRTRGAGLLEEQHRTLRHLIHFIDEGPGGGFTSGAYKEILPEADLFPTSVIWWVSSAKAQKIVEKTITRSGGGATVTAPTPVVWKVYNTDGTTVMAEISDAITYSGVFEIDRTRTITVY